VLNSLISVGILIIFAMTFSSSILSVPWSKINHLFLQVLGGHTGGLLVPVLTLLGPGHLTAASAMPPPGVSCPHRSSISASGSEPSAVLGAEGRGAGGPASLVAALSVTCWLPRLCFMLGPPGFRHPKESETHHHGLPHLQLLCSLLAELPTQGPPSTSV
jgi:hypothetical protein